MATMLRNPVRDQEKNLRNSVNAVPAGLIKHGKQLNVAKFDRIC